MTLLLTRMLANKFSVCIYARLLVNYCSHFGHIINFI
uniref:Uncharacterized protein n=1 Tax=Rhizophora mucronata TaxID=61149 RepID=A0A2P2QIY2_RHIMU